MKLPDDQPERSPGKILDHAAGLGTAGADQVEQRARELAMIDGLPADGVTDTYRQQAEAELLGVVDPTVSNDDEGPIADLESSDDVPSESGGSVAPATNAAVNSDEQSIGERLYSEGVDEADHDRMTQSRKQERQTES